jgi:hypothetical protein
VTRAASSVTSTSERSLKNRSAFSPVLAASWASSINLYWSGVPSGTRIEQNTLRNLDEGWPQPRRISASTASAKAMAWGSPVRRGPRMKLPSKAR